MSSPLADRVVNEALEHGIAFLKFASPNDLGITGAHQKGFYVGIKAAPFLTPQEPVRGVNHEHPITIEWTDGTITQSKVKWYGVAKHEYRITSFNRIHGFWAVAPERLGGLLVLIQRDEDDWLGHVLDAADDIDDVCAGLGLTFDDASWTMFLGAEGVRRDRAVPSACHDARVRESAARVGGYPSTSWMSATAREIVSSCSGGRVAGPDETLVSYLGVEFDLFKAIEERQLLEAVQRGFLTVDDFLREANSALQRRKARAGKSLESHLESVLRDHGVAFEAQPMLGGTRPDFVMPSALAYDVEPRGSEGVFVVAVKTTCKDRWRQIMREGPKATVRYLVTMQHGISSAQMREMKDAGVRLVVPSDRHGDFAQDDRRDLMSLDQFIGLLPKRARDGGSATSLF